jgi:hypothetical protein
LVLACGHGVQRCPKAVEEAHVLLIGTPNTGDAGGDLTAPRRADLRD